ncbi:hypothetical protein VCRA2126O85_20039 [Vibrio crassostreae]|nr:hypothetical protein VCRA2126O86_20039 [Vibrio crassostreae]CAK2827653.1 hypothetical protein VCRA2126O85_20039 [Vibrio crassostreae]CAK2922409.1 hypothetical protein VCRA2126O84_30039 [Vibrio crassostreae]CAK3470719.1 hypothetical protein VCRA2128O109_20039 [Vibrio crassostreae]CAK3865952.1 hypothetical protein VCRA2128O93_20039 [Vibrio crassostreae]
MSEDFFNMHLMVLVKDQSVDKHHLCLGNDTMSMLESLFLLHTGNKSYKHWIPLLLFIHLVYDFIIDNLSLDDLRVSTECK